MSPQTKQSNVSPQVLRAAVSGTAALVLTIATAHAGDLTIPNTFVNGEATDATTMNSNFTAVETAVDDNDARITTNSTSISTNTTAIQSNDTDIANNATGVAANATDIGTNATDIGTNATGVSTNASGIAANSTAIGSNDTELADHETRITALEAGSGGGGSEVATPVTIDCLNDGANAIQNAIDAAPAKGTLVITIDGTCNENVNITRDHVSLINGTDGVINGADSSASVRTSARHTVIEDLDITGGQVGILAENNATLSVSGTTVTGNNSAAAALFSGSALFANAGSVVEILAGNSFTSGGVGEPAGAIALGGSNLRLLGGNNTFAAGSPVNANDDEPVALIVAEGSTLLQEAPASGVSISGSFEIDSASAVLFQVSITADSLSLYRAALLLEPETAGDVTVSVSDEIDLAHSSSLDLGDGDAAVTITGVGGSVATRLTGGSQLALYQGTNMDGFNVEVFSGSLIDSSDGSRITGNLDVHGFSNVVFNEIDTGQGDAAVSGTVQCFGTVSALYSEASNPGVYFDLCAAPI
ncbi:MAG: hypothetical protein AAF434_13270 [Pseudomonadota bacterium]